MEIILLGLVLFLVMLALGLVVVVFGTLKKGKMGVNLAKTGCAQCGTPMPTIQTRQSAASALGRVDLPAMWDGERQVGQTDPAMTQSPAPI
jgi:hypothetical protein